MLKHIKYKRNKSKRNIHPVTWEQIRGITIYRFYFFLHKQRREGPEIKFGKPLQLKMLSHSPNKLKTWMWYTWPTTTSIVPHDHENTTDESTSQQDVLNGMAPSARRARPSRLGDAVIEIPPSPHDLRFDSIGPILFLSLETKTTKHTSFMVLFMIWKLLTPTKRKIVHLLHAGHVEHNGKELF